MVFLRSETLASPVGLVDLSAWLAVRLTRLSPMRKNTPPLSRHTPLRPSFPIHSLMPRSTRLTSKRDRSLRVRSSWAFDQSAWQQNRPMLLYMSMSFHRTPRLGLNSYNNRQYVHGGALDSQTTETQFINHVIGRGRTTGEPHPMTDAKGTPLL